MRNVEYTTRQGPECHPIYEPEEAKDLEITYWDDYRDRVRQGDWILTDDGKVVQILKLGSFPGGKRWLRTCTGTFAIDTPGARVDTEPRQSRHSFSGTYRDPSTSNITDRLVEFAKLYARGMDRISAYKQAFPEAKSEKYIDQKTRVLIKREEIQRIVSQELKDVLKAQGIDTEYIVSGFKELFEHGDNDNARLAALKELGKMEGSVDGKREKTTVQNFLGISGSELQSLQAPKPVKAEDVTTQSEASDRMIEGFDADQE